MDWIKESLIGIGIALMAAAAIFGPQFIRLHQEEKTAEPAYIGTEITVKKPSIKKIRQAAGTEIAEIEPIMVEQVKAYSGITVPDHIAEISKKAGEMYHISPELLQAIAWKESRFEENAVNQAGTCFGIMQISKKWHSRRLAKGEDILDPEANIRIAAEYLAELFERYKEPALVLMIYNGDSRAFKEGYISRYATDVMGLAEELEKIGE